jgi:Xaa-Pro aminopeptidase
MAVALLLLFVNTAVLFGQPIAREKEDDLPKDYLTADFHAGRRAALRSIMPDNSVMVIFAYPTRTYSNDVEYLYHANPDMYYFSG